MEEVGLVREVPEHSHNLVSPGFDASLHRQVREWEWVHGAAGQLLADRHGVSWSCWQDLPHVPLDAHPRTQVVNHGYDLLLMDAVDVGDVQGRAPKRGARDRGAGEVERLAWRIGDTPVEEASHHRVFLLTGLHRTLRERDGLLGPARDVEEFELVELSEEVVCLAGPGLIGRDGHVQCR